jgi:indolepyruvate ferredoxin oxidoreductase beta subunit
MTEREKAENILLAGVGGQGILKASDIICQAIMEAGWDVKKSEVHGMAQRGGSVTSHVRYGAKVFSPVTGKGEVNVLVSFELLEALRYIDYLNSNSKVILNDYRVNPPAVNLGNMKYPENVFELLQGKVAIVSIVSARSLAREAGSVRAENMVMVGALASWLPLERNIWYKVINEFFPPSLISINLRAFDLGYQAL